MNKINSLHFTVNIRRQASPPPPPSPLLLLHQIKSMSMKNIASLSALRDWAYLFLFAVGPFFIHQSPIKTCNLMRLSQLPVTFGRILPKFWINWPVRGPSVNVDDTNKSLGIDSICNIFFSGCCCCCCCCADSFYSFAHFRLPFMWILCVRWWTMTMIALEYGGQLKTND